MINVQINETFHQTGLEDLIIQAAETALLLKYNDISEIDLAIVVTGDEEIQQFNLQFLNNNSPTDVLSFPGGDVDPDTNHLNLGDIIISFPRAEDQALSRQGTVQSELQLLVIHGVLHLMGFDHTEEEGKKEMWSLQYEALKALNLDSINPS